MVVLETPLSNGFVRNNRPNEQSADVFFLYSISDVVTKFPLGWRRSVARVENSDFWIGSLSELTSRSYYDTYRSNYLKRPFVN